MRILQAGCLASLGLAVAASLSMAQTPGKSESASSSWFSGLFTTEKAREPEKKKADAPSPAPTVADRAAALERLEKVYFRRLAVCDRLNDVGVDTDNETLVEEANRLRELAFKTWQEQANKLQGVAPTNLASETSGEESGKAVQDTARVLRGVSSGGGMVPQRIRDGGRIAPDRSAGMREGAR